MAWSAAQFGPSILEMIDEKTVIFGPSKLKSESVQLTGSGWVERNGLWFSNLAWEHRVSGIENRGRQSWNSTHRPTGPRLDDSGDEGDETLRVSDRIPHGHTYYVGKMCVFGNCTEDRVKESRYCALHNPSLHMVIDIPLFPLTRIRRKSRQSTMS